MTIRRFLFSGLVAAALIQFFYYYPSLPPVVASHFDGAGAANGWSGRNFFIVLYLVVIASLVAVFAQLPQWLLNRGARGPGIADPDDWLATPRSPQIDKFFCRQTLALDMLHLLLIIFVMQLVLQANLEQTARLGAGIYPALGLYFVFVTIWLMRLFTHLRKP